MWTNVPLTVPLLDVLLSEPEPKTRNDFLKYSKRITLDPNTANNFLLLSKGNKKVTLLEENQFYFGHPDRFTNCTQILSRESLTGRCYWEVEWSGTEVDLAVSYKSISRSEGDCDFRNTDKSWTLYCHRQIYIFYHNRVETRVSVPVSSRVGVYLDHRAGVLSFYRVSGTMTLLHRVQTCFTQPLHAGVGFYSYGDSATFIEVVSITIKPNSSMQRLSEAGLDSVEESHGFRDAVERQNTRSVIHVHSYSGRNRN
ncbi:hypothetical protein CCH79_00020858 [Gambusia affinis]|uniref:B30.2/SPRY domain-containing protein n=1 Tax=Gambusia affinis TaxID=33528 RepID=A0A315UXA4_GAMAF|nr:hypothetical protein CCH79_00020858 [Gambusia affinis]